MSETVVLDDAPNLSPQPREPDMITTQRQFAGGTALPSTGMTVGELADACGVTPDWVVQRVRNGILAANGSGVPDNWRFGSAELMRARSLCRVDRDFDACDNLTSLVVDICEEVRNIMSTRGTPRR